MRQFFIIAYLSFIVFNIAHSQTPSKNYIHSFEVIAPGIKDPNTLVIYTPNDVAKQVIQYLDGLGREKQTIKVGESPEGFDIIQSTIYNPFGKDVINIQPFCDDKSDGSFRDDEKVTSGSSSFYAKNFEGDGNGKAPLVIEDSPLRRVLMQGAPGNDWQADHLINYNYLGNDVSTDDLKVKLWRVEESTCKTDKLYPLGQLSVTKIIDEDGKIQFEFKNKEGQTILKRKKLNQTNVDTYYVYNKSGLLQFVITPQGSSSQVISFTSEDDFAKQFVYCYSYDSKQRLIEKQIPGKQCEYYVYNQRDDIILQQDGNLRIHGEWKFLKYDALQRIIITGIVKHYGDKTRDQLQSLADLSNICSEYPYYSTSNNYFGKAYYTNLSFPIIEYNDKLLSIQYYDSYYVSGKDSNGSIISKDLRESEDLQFQASSDPQYNNGIQFDKISGYPTVSKTENSSGFLSSVMYYDIYGRVIQSCSQNHIRGFDRYYTYYKGLSNDILQTLHEHSSSLNNIDFQIQEETKNQYSGQGRLVASEYKVGKSELLVESHFEYSPLGSQSKKSIIVNGYPMLSTIYKNNIRGWLTEIKTTSDTKPDGEIFSEQLLYNNVDNLLKNSPLFNGNISASIWQTSVPVNIIKPFIDGQKSYTYSYDDLNRIINSKYAELKDDHWDFNNLFDESLLLNEEEPAYDLNGNILSLKRRGLLPPNGVAGVIDNLSYEYKGNQLIAVDDKENIDGGIDFYDNGQFYYTTGIEEYAYDANGNLIKDNNKGIISISYDINNMPVSVVSTNEDRIVYLYDSKGEKRRQLVYSGGILAKTTDFVGNIVYENGKPGWIKFNEGRIVFAKELSLIAEINITDHLGNVRVSSHLDSDYLQNIQCNSYYPFGLNIKSLSANASHQDHPNEYLYNGKMVQDELDLNWLDYGARFYDPIICRFTSCDPAEEFFQWMTNYQYASNNPVKNIDLDGLEGLVLGIGELLSTEEIPFTEALTRAGGELAGETIESTGVEAPIEAPKLSTEIIENFFRGNKAEAEQLSKEGIPKNSTRIEETDPKTGNKGTTIPDGLTSGGKQSFEVKNVKQQALTKQLRLQEKFSNKNGTRPILRINKGAKISGPLNKSSFIIQRYSILPGTIIKQDNTNIPKAKPPLPTPKPKPTPKPTPKPRPNPLWS